MPDFVERLVVSCSARSINRQPASPLAMGYFNVPGRSMLIAPDGNFVVCSITER